MDEFINMLSIRTVWHSMGAFGVGIGCAWKPFLYVVVVGLIVVKEVFIDPHPTEMYWVKSLLDCGVWFVGMAVGFFTYKYFTSKETQY